MNVVSERKNVLLISEGWSPLRDFPELLAQSSGAVPGPRGGYVIIRETNIL